MKIVPLRHAADVWVSNVDKLTTEGETPVQLCNYVDVYKNDTVCPSESLMRATARRDEIARFHLEVGDTLLTKDSEDPTDIGISAYVAETADDMVCGYHLAIARPHPCTHPRYLTWATRTQPVLDHFTNNSNGISRYGLSTSGLMAAPIPMPSFEEQRRIADFLDDRVARIDQIIAARTAQLVLVHELEGNRLKLAVRGLTGSSPSTRLGRIARIHSGTSFPEDLDADGPYPVVGGNGEMGRGALANAGPGTVVVGRVGALCGNVHLLTEQAWVTDNALVVQGTTTSFDSPFVAATLHAYDLNSIAAKTAQPLVTGTQIADQRIPLVDTTQRQRVIELWENERRADERGLARLQAAIDLLQEYKQSLITAAVTGEFDVTTAAPIPE